MTVGAGRYEIVRPLGHGHFGEVYLATDLDEGGDVAVKLFKPGIKLDDALLEAQLQRRLSDHPRVVSLRNIDARTSAGPIVVTEYRPRGSVADAVGALPAPLTDALRWTRDAGDALAHAHSQGVFHRDVKPSNLLLDSTGHAGLCDFGVAEDSIAGAGGDKTYPALVAPELPSTGTTERTEVFMLGVLLFRLACGEYPFPHGAIGLPVSTQVRPQDRNPQMPMALVRVIQNALAIDPTRRPGSAAAFVEDLLAVKVVTSFVAIPSPTALRAWEAPTSRGRAFVEVFPAPRATFQARLRIDRGSGPRTVEQSPRRTTAPLAFRDAHGLLRAVRRGPSHLSNCVPNRVPNSAELTGRTGHYGRSGRL